MTVPSPRDTPSLRYTQQITSEFKAVQARVGQMTPELLLIFADGEAEVLKRVAAGLRSEGGTDPALPLVHATIHAMAGHGSDKRWAGGPGKGRRSTYSIPLGDVPQKMLQAIKRSRHGDRIKKDLIYELRTVLGAARRTGLPEQFDRAALSVWRKEIDARGLSAKTVERKLRDMRRLGRIFNLDETVQAVIDNEFGAASLAASREPSQRHADFKAQPLAPVDYARAAHRVSEEAFHTTGNRQTVQRLFITAAVLSLLSFVPERVSDILGAIIGRDVSRDARGWSLHYRSQKTAADRSFDYLPDQLTPYFDDLILLGAEPGSRGHNLWHLYRHRVRMESPLFARTDLKRAYSAVRIFQLVKAETGHGPHAARKAMTDYLCETDASPTDILDLLGHRRLSTSQKHYAVRADAIRRQRAVAKVDELRSYLNETGSLRLASGQLIDLEKISKTLGRTQIILDE